MRILKHETAAVVIDIQEKLLPHIHEAEFILQNSLKLIEGLQILEVPIIVTQQYTKGLGNTVPSIVQKFQGFRYIEKVSFSCYDESAFVEQLSASGRSSVILFGIETHVCVLQTCLDLNMSGYVPVVVEDCISSRNPIDKRVAIERMRQEGAIITTYESLLFELTRQAGNEIFKSVSRVVK